MCVLLHAVVCAQPVPYHAGAGWTYFGPLDYTAFGWSMTTAGDVNGDGYEDMIVSAIDYSNPIATEEEEGKLFLFYGGPDGLSSTPAWSYESDQTTTILGFSTSGGDVNGDGYSDIVAGGLQWSGAAEDEGKVFLWYGGPSGPSAGDADWTLTMGQEAALFGSGAAMDGDLNGDGYNDLFVSAKMWDEPELEEGKVWLYWGSPDGPVFSGWTWQPDQQGAIAGFPINYAGDVNADGYEDVVIGVNGYDFIQQDDGLVALFYGGPGLPSSAPDWTGSGGQKKCNFGHWTDGAGDVNGDGYDDIIASALLYESELAEGSEGRVFVFHGGPDGPSATADWFGEVNQLQAQLGYSCAGAGDINGDGYDDVIGGAKYWDNGFADEGGAFVWFGGPDGLETDYCWDGAGGQDSAFYGRHVGGGCDFNNDGYSDFLVGAYRYTELLEADGKGFVYYGAPRPSDFTYAATSFCLEADNPIPTILGTPGGTFASADAIVDPVTGVIDLMATGGGNFSITYTAPDNCSHTVTVTIEDPSLIPWFAYASDTFCIDHPDITPVLTTGGTGIFSSADITIDPVTGVITADSAMAGTHMIYFFGTTDNGCAIADSVSITLLPATTIAFAQDVFCNEQLFTTPIVNNPGGVFSSDDVLINSATGETDLFNSPAGGPFVVTYIANDFCPAVTTTISIDSADHSLTAFSYLNDTVCNNVGGVGVIDDPLLTGGIFTCDGPFVSPATGYFYAGGVTPGTYTVYYTVTSGACTLVDSTLVTVLEGPEAAFFYDEPICFQGSDPVVPYIDEAGGIFSASPDGLVLDSLTGEINLLLSDTGVYYITHVQEDSLCPETYVDTVYVYPACLPPANVAVTEITQHTCLVTWDPVPYYTDYTVQYVKPTGGIINYHCTCTSHTITGLFADSIYIIRVITNCPENFAAVSEDIVIQTLAEVSIHTYDALPISAYPNPVGDLLTIETQQSAPVDVCVFDVWGRLMTCTQVMQRGELDVREWAPGVYYLRVENTFLPIVKQ